METAQAGQKRQARHTTPAAEQWQIDILTEIFEANERPSDRKVNEASIKTGLEGRWVSEWFRSQKRPTRNSSGWTDATGPATSSSCSGNALADSSLATAEAVHTSRPPSLMLPSGGRYDDPPFQTFVAYAPDLGVSTDQAAPVARSFDLYPAPTRSLTRSPSLGYILDAFPDTFTPSDTDQSFFDFSDPQFAELPAPIEPERRHQNELLDFTTFFAPTLSDTFRNSDIFSELSSGLAPPTLDDLSALVPYDMSFLSLQSHSTALLPGSYPAPVSFTTRLSDITAVTRRIRRARDAGLSNEVTPYTQEVNTELGASIICLPADDGGPDKENNHWRDGSKHDEVRLPGSATKKGETVIKQPDRVPSREPTDSAPTSKIPPSSRVLRSAKV